MLSLSILAFSPAAAQWIHTDGVYGGSVLCLAAKGSVVFAGTTHGVYRSEDNGTNWTALTGGFPDITVWTLAISDSFVFAGTDGYGVLRSSDLGNSWSMVNNGLLNTRVSDLFANHSTVFAHGDASLPWRWRSTDNGVSWTRFDLDPDIFGFFKGGDSVIIGLIHYGPSYRSTDNGTTWMSVPVYGYQIARMGNELFTQGSGPFFFSRDSGATWVKFADYSIGAPGIVSNMVSCGALFIGVANYQLCVSEDSCKHWGFQTGWMNVSEGLPYNGAQALCSNDTYMFIGWGSAGVWRRLVSEVTSVNPASGQLPMESALEQNYPNPFNPSTQIKYNVGGTGVSAKGGCASGAEGRGRSNVRLVVYDLLGREVAVLVDERELPGSYEVEFNGGILASGVYVYRLQAGSFAQARTMVLVK